MNIEESLIHNLSEELRPYLRKGQKLVSDYRTFSNGKAFQFDLVVLQDDLVTHIFEIKSSPIHREKAEAIGSQLAQIQSVYSYSFTGKVPVSLYLALYDGLSWSFYKNADLHHSTSIEKLFDEIPALVGDTDRQFKRRSTVLASICLGIAFFSIVLSFIDFFKSGYFPLTNFILGIGGIGVILLLLPTCIHYVNSFQYGKIVITFK